VQLQAQLGLGSYKSAWLLCAKLRRAMLAPERNPLTGLVEADETSVSYRTKGRAQRPVGQAVATTASCWSPAPSRLSVPDEFSLNVPIENSLIGV
jgi:hypothetical protein